MLSFDVVEYVFSLQQREQRMFDQEHNPHYLKIEKKKKNSGIVESIDGIPVTTIDLSVPLHVPGNQLAPPASGNTGPRSAVGNVSGYRCVSDCRSRGREIDPGPVQYFRGD